LHYEPTRKVITLDSQEDDAKPGVWISDTRSRRAKLSDEQRQRIAAPRTRRDEAVSGAAALLALVFAGAARPAT